MSTKVPKNLPLPVYTPGGTKATWMAHLRACRDVHRHNRKLSELRKVARLEPSVSEDAKDAERYRCLRNSDNRGELSVGRMLGVHSEYPAYERVDWLYDEELDAEIDAVLAKAGA